MQAFAESEEGAQLVQEWGNRAPRHVTATRGRVRLMLNATTAADRAKADQWSGRHGSQGRVPALADRS